MLKPFLVLLAILAVLNCENQITTIEVTTNVSMTTENQNATPTPWVWKSDWEEFKSTQDHIPDVDLRMMNEWDRLANETMNLSTREQKRFWRQMTGLQRGDVVIYNSLKTVQPKNLREARNILQRFHHMKGNMEKELKKIMDSRPYQGDLYSLIMRFVVRLFV